MALRATTIHAVCLIFAVAFPAVGWGEDEESDEDTEEVVVVTTEQLPAESPSEAVLIDEDIDANSARSAQELLRATPGVELSQHGSEGKAAQFFLRGFDAVHGSDVTLGVDGLSLNEPSHIHGHGYADSGFLIPEAIRRVRVRKGPFGLDQGNLSTAGDVDYELGVSPEQRGSKIGFEAGWPFQGQAWVVHAPRYNDPGDVIAARMATDLGAFENRRSSRDSLVAQKVWDRWSLRGAVHQSSFGLPAAAPLDDIEAGRIDWGDTPTPDTSGSAEQAWLGAIYETDGDQSTHRTTVDVRARRFDARENFTGFVVDAQYGDEHRQYQRALDLSVGHRTTTDLSDRWRSLLYAGGRLDAFDQFEDRVHSTGSAIERVRGGRGLQGNAYLAAGFDGAPLDSLFVEGGVRLETLFFDVRPDEQLDTVRGQEAFGIAAPRLRATKFLGDRWNATASYGRGYRGPEARPAPGATGAEPGMAARSVTLIDAAEVAMEFKPSTQLRVSGSVFGFYSGAEYLYDHVARRDVDLGATRRLGAELSAKWRLGHRLSTRAYVSGVDARFVDEGEPIPQVPRLQVGLAARGDLGAGFFAGGDWRGVGSRPLGFGADAGGYHLMNLHAGWRRSGWTLRARVDNLFNARWSDGVYHFRSRFDRTEPPPSLPSIHVVPGHPRLITAEVSYRW